MVEPTRKLGRLTLVQWSEVISLQEKGVSFVAVFVGTDQVSRAFDNILTAFLRSHTIYRLLVKVEIDNHVAKQLAISYLPQLRIYTDGKETKRHRGSADYASLNRILQNG